MTAEYHALDDQADRLRRYRDAWEAYYGEYQLPLVVRGRPGRAPIDDNILLGWASEIVDTGVSYLFKDDLRMDVVDPASPDGRSSDLDAAQAWLDRVWRENRRMTTLQKLATNGAVCGHAFIRIRPTITGTPQAFRELPEAEAWNVAQQLPQEP